MPISSPTPEAFLAQPADPEDDLDYAAAETPVEPLILHFGVDRWVSDDVAQPLIGLALLALVYLLLRLLERLKPQIGILLGWIGEPSYGKTLDAELHDATPGIVDAIVEELGKLKAELGSGLLSAIEARMRGTAQEASSQTVAALVKPAEPTVPALDKADAEKMLKRDLVAYVSTKSPTEQTHHRSGDGCCGGSRRDESPRLPGGRRGAFRVVRTGRADDYCTSPKVSTIATVTLQALPMLLSRSW